MTRWEGESEVGITDFQTYIPYKLAQDPMIKTWPYFFLGTKDYV